MVRTKLARAEPFSFVRVGDGEAACFPYEPELALLADGDARARERIWWGKAVSGPRRQRMSASVWSAIWRADCIGIPMSARYLRELNVTRNDRLDRNLTGRGLRAILHAMERWDQLRPGNLPRPIFSSCHLHQDLARWELYAELFSRGPEVVLLSCHQGLSSFMEQRFGTKIAKDIVLPPDRVTGPVLRQEVSHNRTLPEIMDEVLQDMGEAPRGRLVLIGAGYLGKWLADVARSRGGVALDLGSIFDHWLGLSTRSYLDLDAV
jgi:hypothetical protein